MSTGRNNPNRQGVNQHFKDPIVIPINLRPDKLSIEPNDPDKEKQSLGTDKKIDPQDTQVEGLYIISVAARILSMHPQTLRKYERLGFVIPSRTVGMLRLYSDDDIAKLRLIRYMEINLGLNLAGVEFTLNLLHNLLEMRRRFTIQTQLDRAHVIFGQEIKRIFELLNLHL